MAVKRSEPEERMAVQIRATKLPRPEREYRFAKPRRWRFDFAWPERMLALEVEGTTHFGSNANGTMKLGRHQGAKGFEKDCEKYNAAALAGWRVLRVTSPMVRDGRALTALETALEER